MAIGAEYNNYHDAMMGRLGGEATVREEKERMGKEKSEAVKPALRPIGLRDAYTKEVSGPGK